MKNLIMTAVLLVANNALATPFAYDCMLTRVPEHSSQADSPEHSSQEDSRDFTTGGITVTGDFDIPCPDANSVGGSCSPGFTRVKERDTENEIEIRIAQSYNPADHGIVFSVTVKSPEGKVLSNLTGSSSDTADIRANSWNPSEWMNFRCFKQRN